MSISIPTEHLLYYWLSLCRITPLRMLKLLEIYAPFELFDRVKRDKKIGELIGEEKYALLCEKANEEILLKNYDELSRYGVKFLAYCDKEFPERLKQPEVCPPPGLYYKGNLALLDSTCIAIVGTRRCSNYGREAAYKFGSELADYGFCIVSGLATGIDAYAHEAVVKASGKAIAVLGMGHAKFGPLDNVALYQSVCKSGLVVSEYPPEQEGAKYTFPERNRLISGFCEAVIIVEAAGSSGALITAERALEQGREVFAVPGNITSPKSAGTNALIQKGAALLAGTQDILNYFSVKNEKIHLDKPAIQLDIFEQKIYNHLMEFGETNFDDLASSCEFSVHELLSTLLSMEMKGAVVRAAGNRYKIT
ncbi:MAG: DNA-processing protein DprA [Firmicutes bacterium]|nr:DNA-processing protein DprA [Bacillota bacterium]